MESELKLNFPSPEDMDRLWKDPNFSHYLLPGSEKEDVLENVYLDTEEQVLRSLGASLRVRKNKENTYTHTLKRKLEETEGLHQRFEWNMDTESATFSVEYFREHAETDGDPSEVLHELLRAIQGKELKPLFSTNFKRNILMAGFGDSLLEIALDSGLLIANEREATLCEMEIELKEGDVRDVISLGNEIMASSAASIDGRSKYAKCLSLLEDS